jgi:hypothetical protein
MSAEHECPALGEALAMLAKANTRVETLEVALRLIADGDVPHYERDVEARDLMDYAEKVLA